VCDDEWHSYSLLFNGVDDVNLMIDGVAFKADERNPEILDDWPLHQTKTVVRLETLLLGTKAINSLHSRRRDWSWERAGTADNRRWRSSSRVCTFLENLPLYLATLSFSGSLSSVYLLSGETESQSAIECAHRCPEQLQFTGMDEITEGQSVTFSSDQSTITVKASTVPEVNKMLRRISYVNTQEKPIPGHRPWTLTSTVECKNGKQVRRFKQPQSSRFYTVH
ncbi:hypothetical protein ANCDUO_09838, partial [Ancylostoma duodenale]